MIDKLILFQKIYDFTVFLFPLINRIPKSHRLVIGRHLEELTLSLLLLTIKANKARGEERKKLQSQISDQLDSLRILIRLSKDLRFISIKQYAKTAKKLNEIAKILCGWIKVTF